ncbi:MAG: 50S ribosomal protein L24e [archaeon]|nr:50S ribosomal protein L24e [archaeon]
MFTHKKCNFCGKDVTLGRGIMLVRNDGSIYWYCSSKCRKNALELRRDPRKFKWTVHYKKGKE